MYQPSSDVGIAAGVRPPHCAPPEKLAYVDFWPACLHAEEGFTNVIFERFDTLLPRSNAWLRERPRLTILKCETTERCISSPEQLGNTNPKFEMPSPGSSVYAIKGLRLWYTSEIALDAKLASHASQIGYRNYMPHCLDDSPKNLAFDDLSDMFAEVNETIMEKPLEGKIVTVETVPLRLVRPHLDGSDIQPDQSQWQEGARYHLLYITRVFYLFECPAYEQIGAADFLPDFINEDSLKAPSSPKYTDFYSIVVKVNQWLEKVKEVRITNIQCLETTFPGISHEDMVSTSANFLAKADTRPLVKFIRVMYVRPKYGLPPEGLSVPHLITYKTFVPSVVRGGSTCSSGSDCGAQSGPEFEPLAVMWSRVKTWLQQTERRIVGMEAVHHPLPLILRKRDDGETSVIKGLWVFPSSTDLACDVMQRLPTLELIRIYFDGQMNPSPAFPMRSLPPLMPPSPQGTPQLGHHSSYTSSNSPILPQHQPNKTGHPKQACNLL